MLKITSLAAIAIAATCTIASAQSLVGEWQDPAPGWYLGRYSVSQDGPYFVAKVTEGPFAGRTYVRLKRVAQGEFSGEFFSMSDPPERFPATAWINNRQALNVRVHCNNCSIQEWRRLPPPRPRELGPVIKKPGPIRIPPRHNLDQLQLQQKVR